MKKIALMAILIFLSGCASIISSDVLKDVDRSISLQVVQANPDAFKGRKVIWGGIIVKTTNLETVTEIEVLETALAYNDVPTDAKSRGRFLIRVKGYLDAAVYTAGKGVTVAGIIDGVTVRKIGKMDYTYPVITPIELKLSEPYREEYYYNEPYYYGPYYNPYYGPFYGPYYGPYYGLYSPYYYSPPYPPHRTAPY